MNPTAKALATQADHTGMDAAAMFGDPAPRSQFDMVQAAAERRNRLTPCVDIAKAVRGTAQIIATSGDPVRTRARAIDAFIASLDIELRAIASRDVAADARRAGL